MPDSRVFSGTGQQYDAENIFWLGKVSDEALAALLRDSLCLCFPSITEGFGLPALEAMAIGCPVISSDRASLPEVCGDAALYACPRDSESWLTQILTLKGKPHLASELSERGRNRARNFSWRSAAEDYLKLMAKLDGFMVEPMEGTVRDMRDHPVQI
jgi:glycosyltransferase involved in cell wall biosynthesis